MNLDSKNIKIFDWVIPILILGYAAYAMSWVIALVGVAGLWAAWYRPASRMKSFIKRGKK